MTRTSYCDQVHTKKAAQKAMWLLSDSVCM